MNEECVLLGSVGKMERLDGAQGTRTAALWLRRGEAFFGGVEHCDHFVDRQRVAEWLVLTHDFDVAQLAEVEVPLFLQEAQGLLQRNSNFIATHLNSTYIWQM